MRDEEKERDKWSFRVLVIEKAASGFDFPNDWNRRARERGHLDAQIPMPSLWRRLRNAKKSTSFRWWLACFICRDLREELELR